MRFIHDKGKHNKFWSYEIDNEHTVTISWGRLGTKGQSKLYKFHSTWSAQSFVDKKIFEKRRKGYTEVDDEAFGLKQLQAELVGSGCKITELTFVKKDKNLYKVLRESAALADPDYEPMIYCSLFLTGKRGTRHLLIDLEKVYSCWQLGSSKWAGNAETYRLEDIKEIDDASPLELKRIRDKAPALVAALIR